MYCFDKRFLLTMFFITKILNNLNKEVRKNIINNVLFTGIGGQPRSFFRSNDLRWGGNLSR